MFGLLPITIKNGNIPQTQQNVQQQIIWVVQNQVLRWVLQTLSFKNNPIATSGLYNILCADGNVSCWKPVLAAWLADCSECSNLHHLDRQVRFCCEYPKTELGECVPSDKQHHQRDYDLY
jgi:hypothetical protein